MSTSATTGGANGVFQGASQRTFGTRQVTTHRENFTQEVRMVSTSQTSGNVLMITTTRSTKGAGGSTSR